MCARRAHQSSHWSTPPLREAHVSHTQWPSARLSLWPLQDETHGMTRRSPCQLPHVTGACEMGSHLLAAILLLRDLLLPHVGGWMLPGSPRSTAHYFNQSLSQTSKCLALCPFLCALSESCLPGLPCPCHHHSGRGHGPGEWGWPCDGCHCLWPKPRP